jgi:hypothetical protein
VRRRDDHDTPHATLDPDRRTDRRADASRACLRRGIAGEARVALSPRGAPGLEDERCDGLAAQIERPAHTDGIATPAPASHARIRGVGVIASDQGVVGGEELADLLGDSGEHRVRRFATRDERRHAP